MSVLRFIWSGVLAFDRIGSRIPQLVQIWLVEMLFALPLTLFIAKLIDIHGGFGVPGVDESLPGVFWGALALSLVCGFFFFRGLLRPRLVKTSWTPVVHADIPIGGAPVSVFGGNRAWRVDYEYLTSHPSYILLSGITIWIPIVMLWMTTDHGDNVFYWRVAGCVGLIIFGLMALARLLAWYVFRFGREQLDAQVYDSPMSKLVLFTSPSRRDRRNGGPLSHFFAQTLVWAKIGGQLLRARLKTFSNSLPRMPLSSALRTLLTTTGQRVHRGLLRQHFFFAFEDTSLLTFT